MTKQVRAGALTLVIDGGVVRSVRYGREEVLRRVYFAVRDREWGTIPAEMTNVTMEEGERSFRLSYDAEYRQAEIHFAARVTVEGDEKGCVKWVAEGRALSTFMKNRVGLCVLYPMGLAGRRVKVTHGEGPAEQSEFPLRVSPHQPFFDIRALRHEVEEGVTAEVRWDGDVFEMEDQRNWTDGSYKVYSTPLRIPFPAQMKEGTEVRQAVTLRLLPAGLEAVETGDGTVEIAVDEARRARLPELGLGLAQDEVRAQGVWVERVKALNLTHVRAEVDFRKKGAVKALGLAAKVSAATGLKVEAAIVVTHDAEAELRAALETAKAWKLDVCRWMVLPAAKKAAGAEQMQAARRALGGGVPLIAGTLGYFADLNRNRPEAAPADGVCFTANPQVHQTDDATLAENAGGMGAAVECAREWAEGRSVHVSPATLWPRKWHTLDARQKGWLAAVWTVASLKHAAAAGVASITYFETCGDKGVMSRHGEEVFPVWQALRAVGEYAGGEMLWLESGDAGAVDGVALRQERKTRVVVGNFTGEARRVRLRSEGLGALAGAASLDGTEAEVACEAGFVEFTLPPQGMARIDFERPAPEEE